jgi:hypothetical protein
MISYLGFPILWPDKTPFGTICVLDNKSNSYSGKYRRLIEQFRDTIESHLAHAYMDARRTSTGANTRFDDLLARLPLWSTNTELMVRMARARSSTRTKGSGALRAKSDES